MSVSFSSLQRGYEIAHEQRLYNDEQASKLSRLAESLIGSHRVESISDFFVRMRLLEVDPHTFYSSIFRDFLDIPEAYTPGEYVGIITHIQTDSSGAKRVHRYSVTDGLLELDNLIASSTEKDFSFLAPISYCGKRATAEASRFLFAFAIDLDDLRVSDEGYPQGLYNLFYQIYNTTLPMPTYLVSSGTGVHLYYVFDEPLPLWKHNRKALTSIRKRLVKLIWNSFITTSYTDKKIQYESLFQGFRVVGTYTKIGSICRAFAVGNADTVSLEYLLSYIFPDPKDFDKWLSKITPKTKYSYAQLKDLYPDWTQRHFSSDGKPLPKAQQVRLYGGWTCSKAVYDWFLRRISAEIESGHRYHSLMCLASYAEKCGVDFATFKDDCYGLFDVYKNRDTDPSNPWTEYDLQSVLKTYGNPRSRYLTIEAISGYTGLQIKKNKRNYRTLANHVKYMNMQRQFKVELGECTNGGRPNKKALIQEWRKRHPNGTKYQCIKETGISKPTVYKWWD